MWIIYTLQIGGVSHTLKKGYAYTQIAEMKSLDEYEFYEKENLERVDSGDVVEIKIKYAKPMVKKFEKQNLLRNAKIYIIKDDKEYFLPQKYYEEEGLVPLLKKACDPIEKLEQKEKKGKSPSFLLPLNVIANALLKNKFIFRFNFLNQSL